jgi:predicted DNA-binding protein
MEPNRLPHGIEQRLQARARKTGRTVAEVTREAVLDSIEAIEDYYLALSLVRQQHRTGEAGQPRH